MDIELKAINVERDFEHCISFRRDSYYCSFSTYDGYEESVIGYRERMTQRLLSPKWFYIHVWLNGDIIGQLEFRSFSEYPGTGYLHLIYLVLEYRGKGIADKLQKYIAEQLHQAGCTHCVLSVSSSNERAIRHYKRWGWQYLGPNPKHATTVFYRRMLRA